MKKLIGILPGIGLALAISASGSVARDFGATPVSGGSIAAPASGQSIATPHNGGHRALLSYTHNNDTAADGYNCDVSLGTGRSAVLIFIASESFLIPSF